MGLQRLTYPSHITNANYANRRVEISIFKPGITVCTQINEDINIFVVPKHYISYSRKCKYYLDFTSNKIANTSNRLLDFLIFAFCSLEAPFTTSVSKAHSLALNRLSLSTSFKIKLK